ncbi:hypothetical protein Z043_124259 [Scleropages formosus]|uniref:Ig-like domain-containing protein n=1 Tax=Scleropages formosus TaxID=113540 RepID=A0A0P7W5R6_SCLFO|nr:hypothetical protein Z043_124259 [Scleropages formosus]
MGSTRCDLSAVVGDTVTIPLACLDLRADNDLVWKHNTERVFVKEGGKVAAGKDVMSDGSLVLRSVTKDQEGSYSAEVFNSDGKLVYFTVKTLCVTGGHLPGNKRDEFKAAIKKLSEIVNQLESYNGPLPGNKRDEYKAEIQKMPQILEKMDTDD